ncbi:hypothetical protein IMPERIA89_420027 [Imperialibacter sp. 89]|nr:hypothetical protein IMPERIA89_420027 [Imperialibacter sp. 89]
MAVTRLENSAILRGLSHFATLRFEMTACYGGFGGKAKYLRRSMSTATLSTLTSCRLRRRSEASPWEWQ